MVEETIKSIRETENKADQIVKEAEQLLLRSDLPYFLFPG